MSAARVTDREYVKIGSTDRKTTRLNSSHLGISYAVFCLKKKYDRKSRRLNSSHLGISDAVFCLRKTVVRSGAKRTPKPAGLRSSSYSPSAAPRWVAPGRWSPYSSSFFRLARLFFFCNDTATAEIYPLSLLDALPI